MTTTLALYQVDAFADQVFKGNPAAVCPLDDWLPEETMQRLAEENNLSETAFLVKQGDATYGLRWFTPKSEIDLCGHATLASASVIFSEVSPDLDRVSFETKSGTLEVIKKSDILEMDFPARPAAQVEIPDQFCKVHDCNPIAFLRASKNMAVFQTEREVAEFVPDFSYIAQLDGDGLIVTAPGNDCDFVSRYFAPHVGINEDPVTGSAHCTSVPYWAERLGKYELHARQISSRGGDLFCRLDQDRVRMAGHAKLYLKGNVYLP